MTSALRLVTRLALGLLVAVASRRADAQLTCASLRCEGLDAPLAIQEPAPRLSWVLESSARNQVQSAYRILVSTDAARLAADDGDLWDSGRIPSSVTAHIAYAGLPLASRQVCHWKVMSWDGSGTPGPWSAPSRFEMGLLSPADWSAQWLDAAPRHVDVDVVGATYYAIDGSVRTDVTDAVRALAEAGRPVVASNDALGGDPAVNTPKRLRVEYRVEGQPRLADVAENQTVAFAGSSIPLLRRTFTLPESPVVRARLYATALGVYELHLNDQRVGDLHLAPGWTDYRRRVHYQTYDVAHLLRPGRNVLAGVVAPGWFSGRVGLFHISRFYGDHPALLAQLEVTHADGSVTTLGTDGLWRRHDGPTLAADLMDGESYDARAEPRGWRAPGFDDAAWPAPTIRNEQRTLEATPDHPVRALMELPARRVWESAPGRWTFDLGQNMVGVVRLRVHAPAGTTLTLRHAEILDDDGTIYTANLRGAAATDVYTCRGPAPESGAQPEVWQPAFTFHGFRYVELAGLPPEITPTPDMITGVVLGSDLPERGTFECSDAALNQLQSNIRWGLRGNYLSVPTDCPQRDERMGWTADTQVFAPTALFNTDAAPFLSKWLTDLDDAQRDDGAYPDVAPNTRGLTYGVPGWADAGTVVPWTLYQMDADTRVLERHIDSMIRWVEWCRLHSTDLIRDRDRGNDYGDWLSIDAHTPKDLLGTAYFARSADIVARSLDVLGRHDEARRYHDLFRSIRDAFIARYVDDQGRISGATQTGALLALRFNLVPDERRERVVDHLVADIRARGTRLSTGFLGVGLLLPVLSDAGHDHLAAQLLLQDEFPSWLFSVRHGATTIWERWDAWTPQTGPHPDASMNSFNHYSLGSCGQWLFEGLGGLRPDLPGFERVTIRPVLAPGLTWASATFDSVRGRFATRWSIDGERLTLMVRIPPGTTARVNVPSSDPAGVLEGGVPVGDVPGIRVDRADHQHLIVTIGSGSYEFSSRAPGR